MNVGSIASPFSHLQSELRPAELATVGRESLDDNFVSERPVPSVEKSSSSAGTRTLLNTEKQASNVYGTELSPDAEGGVSKQRSASSAGGTDPEKSENAREQAQLLQDQALIQELSARDREVRAHEQAHAAVGGQYAGAPAYQFERGPDGVSYAVGGEVSIDVSKAATPQETILKMQVVRRAALAPAEPSPQDRRVAAQASISEAQARKDLAALTKSEETQPETDSESENSSSEDIERSASANLQDVDTHTSKFPSDSLSHQLSQTILSTQMSSRTGSLFDQHA